LPVIIHIDDNEIDRLILKRSLKKHFEDLEIISVGSVACAEEYLNRIGEPGAEMPDLIITDNNMPEKNGFEFIEFLKSNKNFKQIPLIMLSSSSLDKDVQKALSLGADSYLAKPLNPAAIKHFIQVIEST
jgi:CheY-like chemotaxis protein